MFPRLAPLAVRRRATTTMPRSCASVVLHSFIRVLSLPSLLPLVTMSMMLMLMAMATASSSVRSEDHSPLSLSPSFSAPAASTPCVCRDTEDDGTKSMENGDTAISPSSRSGCGNGLQRLRRDGFRSGMLSVVVTALYFSWAKATRVSSSGASTASPALLFIQAFRCLDRWRRRRRSE